MPKFSALFVSAVLCFGVNVYADTLEPISDGFRTFAFKVAPSKRANKALSASALSARDPSVVASEFVTENQDLLNISNPTTDLITHKAQSDEISSRVKSEQKFRGIPVFGSELTVHMDSLKNVKYVKAKLVSREELPKSVRPRVSLQRAKAVAKRLARAECGGQKLKVSESALEILPLGIIQNKAESDVHLAYRIEVVDAATGGDSCSNTFFIDAKTRESLLKISGHRHIALNKEVMDCSGGANANTCVLNVADTYYPSYLHGKNEPIKTNRGPFPNPNFPLFYGSTDVDFTNDLLQSVQDYYSDTFGIAGINGHNGMADWPSVPWGTSRAVVHTDLTGAGPVCPAGASFSSSTGSVFFCRGMVTTDVVSHEMTHAVVHHSFHATNGEPIGDVYSGQTGSLDEGSADFMGQVFELAYTGSTDWISGTGSAYTFRNLANPPSLVRWDGDGLPYPDRYYHPSFYCGSADTFGAHRNMTVPAHALYLIAQGGEHNGCDIAGVGIDAAQKILFRSWRTYFSRTVNFAEAYTDIIQACNDLYAPSICADVTKALQSVEMNQPGKCSTSAEVAPACAVHHEGAVNTSFKQKNRASTTFAPGAQVWVKGVSGMAGKTVNYYLTSGATNYGTWATFTGAPSGTVTVGADGKFFQQVDTAGAIGAFKVYVDGNQDGAYQPWADTVLAYSVSAPVTGDAVCYQGDSYDTSENCASSPVDCACPAYTHCQDSRFGQGAPMYQCWADYYTASAS